MRTKIAVPLVAATLGALAGGCTRAPSGGSAGAWPSEAAVAAASPAQKLASLHRGCWVEASDPAVGLFENVLSSVAGKTGEAKQDVADIVVAAADQMKKRGLKEDLGQVAVNLDAAIPPGVPAGEMDLREVAAAYTTNRTARPDEASEVVAGDIRALLSSEQGRSMLRRLAGTARSAG